MIVDQEINIRDKITELYRFVPGKIIYLRRLLETEKQ
jgi:hypothetical protein